MARRLAEALAFWAERLAAEGIGAERAGDSLRFADPEGMGLELRAVETDDEPLAAAHPDIPAELALQGFDGVRAYSTEPDASRAFLEETLVFEPRGERAWEARGEERGSFYIYDEPPPSVGSRERAPCTTSPGPRRWRSTRPGGSARRRAARGRRR